MNLAPVRQHLKTLITPNVDDYFVTQIVDVTRAAIPEYGTFHPDQAKFGRHRFSHAEADPNGLNYIFYWLAPRDEQAAYNFETLRADWNDVKFNAVKRTTITLRDEFDPELPIMGAAMADEPIGLFDGDYVLAERRQLRSEERAVDSLFVVEELTYIKRADLVDILLEDVLGIGISRTVSYFYKTEVIDDPDTIEELFADPDNAYWGKLADGRLRVGEQVSDNWFKVTTTSSRDDALAAYKLVLPTVTNLQLPDVLESVTVYWNLASSDGSFESNWSGFAAWNGAPVGSLSGSESASANASASLQPELAINIRQPFGRNIPATAYFFYLPLTAGDTITPTIFIDKLNELAGLVDPATVQYWPVFNPVAHSLVLRGQKAAVAAKASASASISFDSTEDESGDEITGRNSQDLNVGTGEDYDFSTVTGVTRIPPTIHGAITIADAVHAAVTVTADCDVGWTSYSTGETVAGESVEFPEAAADSTASTSVNGSVAPSSLSATTPSSIPSSGLYITDSKIEPYEAGWVRCYAEIVDAADLT